MIALVTIFAGRSGTGTQKSHRNCLQMSLIEMIGIHEYENPAWRPRLPKRDHATEALATHGLPPEAEEPPQSYRPRPWRAE